MDLKPGASNIVPDRFPDFGLAGYFGEVLQRLLERVNDIWHKTADKWDLAVTVERMRLSESAQMSPGIQAVIDGGAWSGT
jgi:hypothetical protein